MAPLNPPHPLGPCVLDASTAKYVSVA